MVQAPGFIRGINPKSKIENPQAPEFIRGVNRKSKIENRKSIDFLFSRSEEILEIEAPAVIIVEAKKSDIRTGFGQCIAEMVAAQKFNEVKKKPIPIIYGVVSNGTQWRFLKLQGQTVTIDLIDYPLPPVEQILGFLVWMVREG